MSVHDQPFARSAGQADLELADFATTFGTERRRRTSSSLIGPVMVAGLIAFFVADSVASGRSAVTAFFVAAGALLVLFFVLAVASIAAGRRRTSRPTPSSRRFLPMAALQAYASETAQGAGFVDLSWMAAEQLRTTKPKQVEPMASAAEINAVFRELLVTIGRLPRGEADHVIRDLLRYLITRSDRPSAATLLHTPIRPEPLASQLRLFTRMVDRVPESVVRSIRDDLWRQVRTR